MPTNPEVVPMPRWSAPVGCAKLLLAILILAFTTACTVIWGGYPAFSITLVTASCSLLTSGYYLTALSFQPKLYNKYAVLILESLLTTFWFVNLILLAGWTGASQNFPRWVWNSSSYISPFGGVDISKRDNDMDEYLSIWYPSGVWTKRYDLPTTPIRVHCHGAHQVARILAGLSAALAGITFILYALTLITFSINLINPHEFRSHPNINTDIESRPETPTPTQPSSTIPIPILPTPPPPAQTASLHVTTLPKDSDNQPQSQQYYLSPEEATEAGIQPPTPVMKAFAAQKEKRQSADADVDGGMELGGRKKKEIVEK